MSDIESETDAIVWPERPRVPLPEVLRPGRAHAFERIYRAVRLADGEIEPWEAAGLRFVLDRLSRFGYTEAHRIGLSDEPWANAGVLRGLR